MPDPTDPAAPAGPPARAAEAGRAAPASAPRSARKKKFVLPEHHHDELGDARAAGHIEAFLDGAVSQPRPRPEGPERIRRPLVLDTRQDWMAALRHESARNARYGRATSVVLLELKRLSDGPAVERIALTLADLIRGQGRETDRAVRIDALGFRLLLPETAGRAARNLADRLDKAFNARPDVRSEGVELCIEVASAQRARTLEDALADAEARLRARTRPD